MAPTKRPGLLIRISHLILIQILFIFGALALVIFYPQDTKSPSESLKDIENKASLTTSKIVQLIKNQSFSDNLDSATVYSLNKLAQKNPLIISVDIYHLNSNRPSNHIYGYLNQGWSEPNVDSLSEHLVGTISAYLGGTGRKNLTCWKPDGDHIKHIAVRSAAGNELAVIIRTAGIQESKSDNALGYILLLLFLVSALISLLLMHLISMGIRKPLEELLAGFEETASGNVHILEERKYDKGILELTRSFNSMSQKLHEQKQKLIETNRELMSVNKSLLDSESILTSLVDYSPDAIIVTDLEDHIIIYNQAAARDFGFREFNMIGKRISSLLPPARLKPGEATNKPNDSEGKEIICRRRDGSRFPAMLVQTPLGPEKENPMAILYFIKNISESEKYQNMILRLDRIASRGKMARDIAHEINNYLAILQGNLELLPIFISGNDPEKTESKIELMKKTVRNITTFTEGLSRFSDENSEFGKEDFNQLVENLLAFVKPQNRFDNISIETNLCDEMPMVEIDAAQCQHLIVNLLSNAAEAQSEAKGKKWIAVSTAVDEEKKYFYLKIINGGPGIEEEYLERLFVGRFSTKRDGTGLGLITCKNIVDNHNGEISYHSSEESKAIFIIKMPVHHSDLDAEKIEKSSSSKQTVTG